MNQETLDLIEKHKSLMYKVARKAGAKHEEAQDAVGHAIEQMMAMGDQALESINQSKLVGYLVTATRNWFYKMRETSGYDKKSEKVYEEIKVRRSNQEKELMVSIAVHRALNRLKTFESEIAWKYWALEMTLKEIIEDFAARGIKWPSTTLYRYITKVLKPKLKKELMKEGGDKL